MNHHFIGMPNSDITAPSDAYFLVGAGSQSSSGNGSASSNLALLLSQEPKWCRKAGPNAACEACLCGIQEQAGIDGAPLMTRTGKSDTTSHRRRASAT